MKRVNAVTRVSGTLTVNGGCDSNLRDATRNEYEVDYGIKAVHGW